MNRRTLSITITAWALVAVGLIGLSVYSDTHAAAPQQTAVSAIQAADLAQFSTKVYREQGGNKLVVASGGTLEIQSGATFTSEAGLDAPVDSNLTLGGTTAASVLLGGGVATSVDTLSLLQAQSGLDSFGRITTTDGVSSGTARVVGGRAYSQTAAGSAHTGSTNETVLGSYTIPANTLKSGSVMKVRYQGIVTADNSTTTLTVVLRLGPTTLTGQALISHAATDTGANDIFTGEFTLVARAAPGATAACVGVGTYSEPAAAGGALKTAYLGSTNFATNGALRVEVTADWSAADANSCRLDVLNVEIY